jgi:hypothetical protein
MICSKCGKGKGDVKEKDGKLICRQCCELALDKRTSSNVIPFLPHPVDMARRCGYSGA